MLEGFWRWDNRQKATGTQSHMDPLTDGLHQHFFYNASQGLTLNAGDKIVCYVLVNPCHPPQQVMLQWHEPAQGWDHRAYWGADLISWGIPGTQSRYPMGALPQAGQWVRLEVPASVVGLEGKTVNGMAFTLYGGQAWFDRVSKTSGGPPPSGDNASFITQSPPPIQMVTGQTANVSVTMQNTGTTTWTPQTGYKLGSQNPTDNLNWGLNRVEMAGGASVAPGSQYTFNFTVTAPLSPGTYNFQWRMLREGAGWFGEVSTNISVAVASPSNKINPVAVTASNSYPGYPPSSAVDSNLGTNWNSGGYAPQWIQLDLGQTYSVSQVRLNVNQFPSGSTIHEIHGGATTSTLSLLRTLSGTTQSGQWLQANFSPAAGNIRFLKVLTTSSPSWISWYEIEVYGTGGGPTVPAAPSTLTATAVSSTQVNLAWSDNSTNETGFKIERKTGAGGIWGLVTTTGQNVTSHPDTGLTASTIYYYRVRATNAAGGFGLFE